MDDLFVLAASLGVCGEAVEAARVALAALGLRFSAEKSREFDDPASAIFFVEDEVVSLELGKVAEDNEVKASGCGPSLVEKGMA